MNKMRPIAIVVAFGAFLLGSGAAKNKAIYQTTRLIELQNYEPGFCFVFKVDDLAYIAIARDRVPHNLIVGDPMEIKITGDHVWIKTDKKWPDDEIKARISIRQRMTADAKLPTCSLPVSVH
jgi:hypothetical protein